MMSGLSLLGVRLGDAMGAGWEMVSAEFVRRNWNQLTNGYRQRDSGYDQNHRLGGYTDDFEMTLGVQRALQQTPRLTKDSLINSFIYVHQLNAVKRGARCGYGSFQRVLDKYEAQEDWLAQLKINRISQSNSAPGNGDLMRLMPIFLFNREDRDYNVMINSLATHPNPVSVFSSLAIMRAAEFVLESEKPVIFGDLILDNLKVVPDKFYRYLPILMEDEYFQRDMSLIDADIDRIRTRLLDIEQLPILERGDQKLFSLSDEHREILYAPYATKLNGAAGLAGKSEQTLYCVLYLLKNAGSTSAWGNLLRCIAVGGDTDTLAAIVMGILLPYFGERELRKFPSWVFTQLETPPYELFGPKNE